MSATSSSNARPRQRRPYAPRVPIEERREQLLDAALAVIVDDGFDRVSIDAVAKRADVARSVVYGAFENLGALLGALLDRQQARAYGQLMETLADGAELRDPAEFAAATVRRMSAMLRADPDTWRLILLPPGAMPPIVLERIEADRARFRDHVAEWISVALAGRGVTGLDPQVLAHALVACAEHFGRLALTDPETFDPAHLVDQVRLLLRLALPPR
ncbi:TetR/AcrR family transcriptional regulator [Streptacidiphilus pinicola]|uniref:TetR/AcrR family transcriptional regulator n=1 Tax=Streptacidiphilus pinicola TaxID=2219663 RepID=A0A2X0IDM5_9ACTN|nr:TetR/AcrR family transcriptional regulator [Streptacidiphilus pinicola]RAG82627.1 TetR/AcrR family transcriptional regulator [Streptacidiphilus pinicola]